MTRGLGKVILVVYQEMAPISRLTVVPPGNPVLNPNNLSPGHSAKFHPVSSSGNSKKRLRF
jgi:hypothetical protein